MMEPRTSPYVSLTPEALVIGLTECEWAILDALFRAGNRWIDRDTLNEMTAPASCQYDHAADERSPGALHVHICRIRQKLGADSVLYMIGRGYTIGAPGIYAYRRAKCAPLTSAGVG
jgi:DNA-binding response OmpR family regulator